MIKLICIALLASATLAQERYNSQLDSSFDISELLKNKRLLLSYSRCLLDKGPCTPEVKSVKDKLPEALATKCAKCTDKQKELGRKLATEMKRTYPDIWRDLVTKYDPQGLHQEAFRDFLQKP